LALRSRYGKRLYELLNSYLGQTYKLVKRTFGLDELKSLLNAQTYDRFPDFKRYALDAAVCGINEFTDLFIRYDVTKTGRKFTGVEFAIYRKPPNERFVAHETAENLMDTSKRRDDSFVSDSETVPAS